uniref:Sporulation protein SsgA n=1 Tax=Pseudofrankia asymbiotica TaxID=1834516 RepID=A0A1V2IB95_9ACTN
MKEMSCDLPVLLVTSNGERLPLKAHLNYDPADPIAVTLVIRAESGEFVRWTFARALLAANGSRSTNIGDVRVQPTDGRKGRVMTLTLTCPEGRAELELPAQRVAAFLHRTYRAVPAYVEAGLINWDAEFGALLGFGVPKRGVDDV